MKKSFDAKENILYGSYRCCGQSVRAVCAKKVQSYYILKTF